MPQTLGLPGPVVGSQIGSCLSRILLSYGYFGYLVTLERFSIWNDMGDTS